MGGGNAREEVVVGTRTRSQGPCLAYTFGISTVVDLEEEEAGSISPGEPEVEEGLLMWLAEHVSPLRAVVEGHFSEEEYCSLFLF